MAPLVLDRRRMLQALASFGVGALSVPAIAAGDPIAVVVSPSSRQRGLTSDKLRRIFLALPTDSDDGRRFIPINLAPTSGSRARFDRTVLAMTPEDVARYWIDQRLRGNKPPRSAATVDICRGAVQELPGAIAYLPLSQVGPLRVLTIDGRNPSDSAYALK
jgi:ABC-type phosphate transport system substrate-binding protein